MSTTFRKPAMAVALVACAIVGLLAAPAAAEEPDLPYFEDISGTSVSVKGTYQPIVGHFTDLALDDIIWYAPGPTQDQHWTPCPGCDTGRFTKKPLDPQVNGHYLPIVGDFAGDNLDDIFWQNWDDGGHDYLWTNNGSGAFSSRPLDMANDLWLPVVLTDSQSGGGKDDILWIPESHRRTAPLWVFPDNGSGAAHTVARLTVPFGTPLVGDYDGNGAADIFFYNGMTGCRCEEVGPAEKIDTYWRRASSTAPGFTATTTNVKGLYDPVVGHFGGEGDERADILWVGSGTPTGSTDGPDSLWEGRTTGAFKASTVTVPGVRPVVVLGHDVADTVYLPNAETVWFDTESGPVFRPTGSVPVWSGQSIIGRFTSPDRADLFIYAPGRTPEHLLHPTF